jgi:hypothetical protein
MKKRMQCKYKNITQVKLKKNALQKTLQGILNQLHT